MWAVSGQHCCQTQSAFWLGPKLPQEISKPGGLDRYNLPAACHHCNGMRRLTCSVELFGVVVVSVGRSSHCEGDHARSQLGAHILGRPEFCRRWAWRRGRRQAVMHRRRVCLLGEFRPQRRRSLPASAVGPPLPSAWCERWRPSGTRCTHCACCPTSANQPPPSACCHCRLPAVQRACGVGRLCNRGMHPLPVLCR